MRHPHELTTAFSIRWDHFINTDRVQRQCCCCCRWLSRGDRFLSHHELRPSVGPVLNPYPHNGVCVCVCRHRAEVSAYACAYACVVSSLCPIYFISPATLRLPSTTLAIPSQPTHTGRGSVDQWSRVPTGTVIEQIASIAAVMNATSVHSL